MIKLHPTQYQLEAFAQGILPPAEALIVSAHCDMCQECQSIVSNHNELLAQEAFGSTAELGEEYNDILANIIHLPQAKPTVVKPQIKSIELDGKSFELPRALQRYATKTGNWSKLVGKLWQAPVDLGDMGVANFIYMEKGGSVPEHTHRGTEHTLVINGEFSDGLNDYDTGDLIFMDGQNVHAPQSHADEGCLVFTIVDQPLHFTSGLARLLNPFSHLFFR